MFTPDSKRLAVYREEAGLVEMLSTETWETVLTKHVDESGVYSLGFVGFSPDGATMLAVASGGTGGGSLVWLDAASLEVTKMVEDAHVGSIKSHSVSPDGSLLATGAADGIVRVWDATSGVLRQQMEFASQVQGLAFIDERHLAVIPQRSGELFVMTVDAAELAATVRASISRGFTATECSTYDIDPCPTLEQSRGS